ncbi:transketolase C-terminal domain-containing protein [Vulcanisaeta moutnovskia]|uniref:transketolase C-terminal domain-containing protein n=1 Tax=Vulcanisaeta moutnovskia TaxID=985052 RepID=UPI000AA690E1|nr:transketolase C-terminal domain-containing protein [Vulcanisaeta moutnovskia]
MLNACGSYGISRIPMVINGSKVSIDLNRLMEVRDSARDLLTRLDREFPYIHLGSSLAALDIINVLIRIMRRNNDDCRDWFILSIGHVAPALYAILAVEGLIPEERLMEVNQLSSSISTHADNMDLPYIDATTGSLGQGLSMGVGLALAGRVRDCNDGFVYVLMGDGELNEGQTWEAATTAVKYGLDNLKVIVSLNGYQLDGATSTIKPISYARVFEAIGWNVLFGNGHDYEEIIRLINKAHEFKGKPTVIFLSTIRGKGIRNLENTSKQTLNPPPRPQFSMREALGTTLARLGEDNDRLVVVTTDVGESTRARYFGERFPNRYFNIGISEQDLVGVSVGLALGGYVPVAMAYSMFMMRGWEQIRNSLGRMNLNVKLIATHAGLSDFADGPSHQALEDVALMRTLNNMVIVAPADAWDVERIIPRIIEYKGPVYARIGRDYSPPITMDMDYEFKIGEVYELIDGDDVIVMGYGPPLYNAVRAATELRRIGIRMGVYNVPTIKPLNNDAVSRIARRVGNVIVVEEHSPRGGLGSAIAELVSGFARVKVLGVDGYGHWGRSEEELLRFFGLDEESIMDVALKLVNS